MTRWARTFLCLTVLFLFASLCSCRHDEGGAPNIPNKPNPPRLVNDFANILTDSQKQDLEKKLVSYNDSTSTQICVVTVKSLNGYESNDYAQRLGEKWGVGSKKDNGVVILVKPKTKNEDGDVAIQTGYGMEPIITDAIAGRIIRKKMIPAFKEGNYYKGIDEACDVIIGLAQGTYSADELNDGKGNNEERNDEWLGIFVVFLAITVVLVLIWASKKGHMNNGSGTSGRKLSFWEGLLFGIFMSGGRRGGGWGGSGGGSWGGGHSSGGFGGFGGGHFGGGGASGKW